VALGVSRGERGLADAAQAVQRGDGDAALVAAQRRGDGGKRILAAQKMFRHPDGNVGNGKHLAGKRGRGRRFALLHEFAKAQARGILRDAEQFAAADMVGQGGQLGWLHRHEQHEAGPVAGGLPERRVAFEGGVGRLQVFVGNDAEHMLGGVMALLHPGINVIAAPDLPFVDMWRVAESLQLLGDPECPVAVATRVADKNIRHAIPRLRPGSIMVMGPAGRKAGSRWGATETPLGIAAAMS